MKILTLTLLFLVTCNGQRGRNNVCTTMLDYFIKDWSRNCRYNPDVGAYPEEVVNRYGYPFESHRVITEDNYTLTVMRIPQPKGRPIFIQHGILANVANWIGIGNKSIPFILFNAGYDVWMGNFRGTFFSNEHLNPDIPKDEYWDFSFHELGLYDLPAMINYVASHTERKEKIIYIGHSMGTTASYIYSILRKSEAEEHLAALISLAPVAYMGHFDKFATTAARFREIILFVARLVDVFSLGSGNTEELVLYYKTCIFGITSVGCQILSRVALALISNSVEPEALPIFLSWSPSSTSLKTFSHYGQEATSDGEFRHFDYGSRNQEIYGSAKPPIYNVSKITVPVYLLYGRKDTVGDEQDVRRLYDALTTDKQITPIAENGEVEYNHLDFTFSSNIEYVVTPLLRIIDEINN